MQLFGERQPAKTSPVSNLEAPTGQMGVLDTAPWTCVPQSLSAHSPPYPILAKTGPTQDPTSP